MKARLGILLLVVLAVNVYAEPEDSARVAPIYSLPKDGVWLDFDFQYLDVRNKEHKGKMRISSVGQKRTKDGVQCRWIEIKMEGTTFEPRWGKFLVAESVFNQPGHNLETGVVEAYHQEGLDGRVLTMTGTQIHDYFTMGVRGELRPVKQEVLETKLAKFDAKKVMANGRGKQRANRADEAPGVHRDLEYRAWLTPDSPFGVARFEIWGRINNEPPHIAFQAEVTRMGTGAKSEINEARPK